MKMPDYRMIDRLLKREGFSRRHCCGGWAKVCGLINKDENLRGLVVVLRCIKCAHIDPVFLWDVPGEMIDHIENWANRQEGWVDA